MAVPPQGFLILDANVLIDYCAADRTILTLISSHVGQVHVPVELLEEVKALDEGECERLGLRVFEPELELLMTAGKRRPGLSYYDHLCLIAENVPVLWGLEPMIDLVGSGNLTVAEAKKIAHTIQTENPLYITAAVVGRFLQKIETVARRGRKR
jgi:hypothetical protein